MLLLQSNIFYYSLRREFNTKPSVDNVQFNPPKSNKQKLVRPTHIRPSSPKRWSLPFKIKAQSREVVVMRRVREDTVGAPANQRLCFAAPHWTINTATWLRGIQKDRARQREEGRLVSTALQLLQDWNYSPAFKTRTLCRSIIPFQRTEGQTCGSDIDQSHRKPVSSGS